MSHTPRQSMYMFSKHNTRACYLNTRKRISLCVYAKERFDLMKLSKRMKEILLLLLKADQLTRNGIVFHLERKTLFSSNEEVFVKSSVSTEYLLSDKFRVSYDRTFKYLREYGLIKGGFPSELRPFSSYHGTLWRGYLYELTPKGKIKAEEIRTKLLNSIERYSLILHEQLFS